MAADAPPARALEVDVVIPAENAARTIAEVVRAVPSRLVRRVLVVDGGSNDGTARLAEDAGAVVVRASRPGPGAACQRALEHLRSLPRPPDIVVFCAADGTDEPGEIATLVAPLRDGLFDLVIGSRVLGRGRLLPGQKAANLVAVHLIQAIYGHKYTDLGPFRAIRYPALVALGLKDGDTGWLVEMQVKALKAGLRVAEAAVSMRRPGKPDGTAVRRVRESVGTGTRVLFQIFRHATAR